jgi:DNA repair protein RecO (recombination protein O)
LKINAIVLHSIKYRENDVIAYLYTQQMGRQTYIVHNALKPSGQRQIALVQPLFLLELEVQPSKKQHGMGIVKEMQVAVPLAGIAGNIKKNIIAMFISETIYRFVKEEEANPVLYDFLEQQIITLDTMQADAANFHLYFLSGLARHLGFLPDNSYDAQQRCFFDLHSGCFTDTPPPHLQYLDAAASGLLWQMLHCTANDLSTFALNHTQRNTLTNGLLYYYSFHLGISNPIRSFAVLREVFA